MGADHITPPQKKHTYITQQELHSGRRYNRCSEADSICCSGTTWSLRSLQ